MMLRVWNKPMVPTGHRVARVAERGFTLAEVVIALALATLTVGGIVYGYIQAAERAEWSAYSLAAQSLAMQKIEQTRACKWDPMGYPPTDQLVSSNFPAEVEVMDIPLSGTNLVYATNTTTITAVSVNPALRMIEVECTWAFPRRGVFTNTVVTYRAPDQ
ncbi:MAG: hypothetical protein KGS61_02615 [Verrucomicrobia bacterium]|nr:hypothetical protein [Verrucomicrobiota bacterium]